LLLSSQDRTLTTQQLDGKFPDWHQVMPKGNPVAVVAVQPKLLAETLTALAAMLGDEFQRVTLCFFKPGEPIGLVAKNSVACIDALLMPLTPDPEPPKKREPQASIDETVKEYFTELFDLSGEQLRAEDRENDVQYHTDEIDDAFDLPWSRDIVQKAVEA